MIRQAISCDICGTEKKQTNHWFVAYDQGGELRVSGWNTRNRLRPGSKHLCGQTCLHKLVDEFMAALMPRGRTRVEPVEADVEEQTPDTNASLTSGAAYAEVESSARLITPPAARARRCGRCSSPRPSCWLFRPGRAAREPEDNAPTNRHVYMSRQWRAEAWERDASANSAPSSAAPNCPAAAAPAECFSYCAGWRRVASSASSPASSNTGIFSSAPFPALSRPLRQPPRSWSFCSPTLRSCRPPPQFSPCLVARQRRQRTG